MNVFYSVQNLSCPADGSQLIVSNAYTVSFYNPYKMYEADWNENTITLSAHVVGELGSRELKKQAVTTGNNTLSFRLSDYGLPVGQVERVYVLIRSYITVDDDMYTLYFTSSPKDVLEYPNPIFYTSCYWDASASCAVNKTLSTENVMLSWSGAQPGTANAITGYEVQRCESAIGGDPWSEWETCPGSPVTGTSLSVSPPSTAGHYYLYRVRARGAAGSAYYSGWEQSTNALRRDHAPLAGFTDPTLTAGVSPVKALHMTELHDRVNTLRTFYGLSAYAFSLIDERGIAGWTDHVNEIKEAIEGVCAASGKTHEAWISFSVNCPRADVISQLRAVVLAL